MRIEFGPFTITNNHTGFVDITKQGVIGGSPQAAIVITESEAFALAELLSTIMTYDSVGGVEDKLRNPERT